MQHSRAHEQPQNSQQLEMSLREHLLAAGASGSAPPPYPTAPAPTQNPYQHSEASSPHDHHQHNPNIDPNVTGEPMSYPPGADSEDMSPDARKGKRELSTSKRAAQNRAAQRAFRQRKEGYIKKLEEQVKELQTMEHNFKTLQNENYQLREYILNLQARLLENQADFPPAPQHAQLTAPPPHQQPGDAYGPEQQLRREMQQQAQQQHQQHPPPPAPVTAREDPIRHDGISQLQAAAAASNDHPSSHSTPYGLGNDYNPNKRSRTEETRPAPSDVKPPA